MEDACAPHASDATRLAFVSAVFDTNPTNAGRIRVPCSYNAKKGGSHGFPLPPPTSAASQWPPGAIETQLAKLGNKNRPSHSNVVEDAARPA